MLTMPEINYIKLMRNQKSLSINQISKTLGINWRTAKKYADGDQLPIEKKHDYGQVILPLAPSFLPLNAKKFTTQCQFVYQFTETVFQLGRERF